MSNELTVAQDRGQSLAELMGVSSAPSAQATPSIARLNIVSQAVKGEMEFNGKTMTVDTVPVGSLKLDVGDDTIYAPSAKIRIFAMRYRFQRWNADTNEMEKTVMANDLKKDLQDNLGGFNLGRPSGYIEDFQSLPQKLKDVKRVKVFYGTVTLESPIDSNGKEVSTDVDIPFVWDIKNTPSIKSIDGALGVLQRKNLLPIMSFINVKGVDATVPGGPSWGKVEASVGERVDIEPTDNETLANFIELIEYSNGKIIDMHNERNGSGISDADAAVVKDIIDNDFVEVDE
jgi:hypothetical protein